MKKFCQWGVLWLLVTMSACGPSAQRIATMTASAWTPTSPPPTSTPTPLPPPYDLTVTIVDEMGMPVEGAQVLFPESGNGTQALVNDQGQYTWNDLPGDVVSLTVSAQGYLPTQQSATIQRGPNEITVTLTRDPFGLLPSQVCATDQKVLYIEDFQDGQAQGWGSLSLGIEGKMPNGWTIIDESGNKILVHANAPSGGGDELQEQTFENFVWHLKFKMIGNDADMFFMWRVSHDADATKRYVIVLGAKQRPWMVRFFDTSAGPNPLNVAETSQRLKENQWYNFDVVYFDGLHQVWTDGKLLMQYKDSQPYPAGTIGFETHLDSSKATQFFLDELVVCELTAPYAPPQ